MTRTIRTRQYTADEREQAILKAEEVGPSAAGSELDIPAGTIAYWQHLKRRKGKKQATEATIRERDGSSDESREVTSSAKTPSMPSAPGESEADSHSEQPDAGVSAKLPIQVSAPAMRPAAEGCPGPSASPGEADSSARPSGSKRTGRRVARVYTPSERAQILECADKEGVTAACKEHGVSEFSIHNWRRLARLRAEGKAAASPVVGGNEDRKAAVCKRILDIWRAHPGLGPSQIRNQLRRENMKVSIHTVRCVLEENGYVHPKVRREVVHDKRYEAVRPNHMWHLDFLHRHIHKQKVYILLVMDDFSRFIVAAVIVNGERVAAVQEAFLGAVNRYGKPEKAMSDGGSAFCAWKGVGAFTNLLNELEVDQLIAQIPQVNGKIEALNGNIQKELFNKVIFSDLEDANHGLSAWIQHYNFGRTHHALGGLLVPADRYFGRADEVLAQIEAGRSPSGVDEPIPPAERQVDLFRVSSCRGQVELHLLGHRIVLPISSAGTEVE